MKALTAPSLANYYNAIALLSSIEKIVRSNRNIGLQGQICHNCFCCWVDPVFNNEEEMRSLLKIKPLSHICDPKKVEDLQKNIQDVQGKKKRLYNDLISILLQLVIIIYLGFSQMRAVHLKAEELFLPPQVNNDNDTKMQFLAGEEAYGGIDLGNVEAKDWAHNLFKEASEKSIPMLMPDLIDFLSTAKASFAFFKTKINGSMRYFFIYLDIKG